MTILEVKAALNIDFPDQDSYLELLLNAAVQRAESVIGSAIIDPKTCEVRADVQVAILQDVATRYQNRDDSGVDNNLASIATYRRLCRNPMF